MRTTILLSLLFTIASWSAEAPSTDAQALVEQMRGHSMQPAAQVRSDGSVSPEEKLRQEIIGKLRALGPPCLPSLVAVLSDPEVPMRRNAELVLVQLAGGYDGKPKMDIRPAIPALIAATKDSDPDVRAWAAHALAETGPAAAPAIPALLILLQDAHEGPRNTSCIALGNIGPAARSALPALHQALSDPSPDVRKFAQRAIGQIEQ